MILFSKYLVPRGYLGITFFPFVFLKCKELKSNEHLLNHEKIHLKQQLELLVLPFYLWYGIEFLIRFFMYKKWDKAYKSISFEREAYTNEKDLDYIESRPFWSFIKFVNV